MSWPIGKFEGFPIIEIRGPESYLHLPDNGFCFTRASGEVITPGRFWTDGGTIPLTFQNLPHFGRMYYFWGYVCHDWEFAQHHLSSLRTFEDANAILAECITTMIAGGYGGDILTVDLIHTAVSSVYGRRRWDGEANE